MVDLVALKLCALPTKDDLTFNGFADQRVRKRLVLNDIHTMSWPREAR